VNIAVHFIKARKNLIQVRSGGGARYRGKKERGRVTRTVVIMVIISQG